MLSKAGPLLVGLILVLAGCAEVGQPRIPAPEPPVATSVVPGPTTAPAIDIPCVETSHGCIALNSDVTDGTIGRTICLPGYTQTVRPLTSYTNGVKTKLLRESGIGESHMGDYELDHIVPLAVGGAPKEAIQPASNDSWRWHKRLSGAPPKSALQRNDDTALHNPGQIRQPSLSHLRP